MQRKLCKRELAESKMLRIVLRLQKILLKMNMIKQGLLSSEVSQKMGFNGRYV